ncbi:MAG: peroxidase-related enzyme [Candidatus Thermoplasmatota archaeon]|nr:peroxidase-related enzyme [Candidatus Thermoplasmatota archaeon]
MAWIRTIGDEEATGHVKSLYQKIVGQRGKLSNIMRVHSLCPEALAAHLELYQVLMFESDTLTREEREAIAVVVSAANGCQYCLRHHAAALRHYWKDEKRVKQLGQDRGSLELSSRLRAMLDYAEKVTLTPHRMQRGDVERLRAAGLEDGDILTVSLVAGYFNFVNRIALGLGVEWTPDEVDGYRY